MRYSVNEKYNCVVYEMKGNLIGGPDADKFKEAIKNHIDEGKTNVVIDLGSLKFMNSSGLGILVSGMTSLRNADGDLKIARANEKIESILMVTKLVTVFDHYKTVEEAATAFDS